MFEILELRLDHLDDLGDQVIASGVVRLRPRGAGPETQTTFAALYRWTGEKLIHCKDIGQCIEERR